MSGEHPTFVEIHNHLLPGVDDGSRSLEESLRHLRSLFDDGVRRLAFSPHLFGWIAGEHGGVDGRISELRRAFEQVRRAVCDESGVPALTLGQEVLLRSAALARRVARAPDVGYAGTAYVLLEFGFDLPTDCVAIVREVLDAGRRPIVAHPERYRRDGERVDVDEVAAWKEAGALLQVNAGSLAGKYAPDIERLAWRLVHHGLADIVGSDNHADSRPQSPLEAHRLLHSAAGESLARLLLHENPGRVLDDLDPRPVPAAPDAIPARAAATDEERRRRATARG